MDYLTLKDMQKQVDDWIQENKGYWTPLSIMAQITEESGELARILNNMYGGRIKKLDDPEFALICLANSHNIDLDNAWRETIAKRCKRDENRYR